MSGAQIVKYSAMISGAILGIIRKCKKNRASLFNESNLWHITSAYFFQIAQEK